MRSTLAITLCLVMVTACGDAERSADSGAPSRPDAAVAPRARTLAELVAAEAEILARAGMGFQRRWLDWHLAGRPSQDPFQHRTGIVAGYEPGGFEPARVPEADRAALLEVRAAIKAFPPAELRARYQALVALHGNAAFDASRTGSLRISDDGQHLVFADGDDDRGAYAWRIADGRLVGRTSLRVSEDPFWTRDVLPSGLVWSQWTPTPAGRKLAVWDVVAGAQRWSHLIGDDKVLAVSSDGQRAALASGRAVVIRGGPRLRPIARLGPMAGASRRAAFSGDGQLLAIFAVVSGHTRLRLFQATSGALRREIAVSIGHLSHIDVDRAGRRVVGYAPGKNALAIWQDGVERVIAAGAPVDRLALSADAALALVARGKRLELLDLTTGAARWTVELSDAARLVALGAAAGLVAWWTDDELAVASLADGRPLPSFAGHRTWPSEETHREALALATVLEDAAPPMYEAGFRDPFREADALDAELSAAWLGWLPRAELALLPDLVEAHRGKPLRSGPAAAIVRAWREGCDGWYERENPAYSPDELQPVDRRNLEAIHREIARRGAASPEATPAGSRRALGPRPCR